MTQPPGTGWQDVVDLDVLTAWLRRSGVGDQVGEVTALGGGTQNIVLLLDVDGHRLVLRRPPRHPRPDSDRTMLREIAVLQSLAGTDVPHPRLVAAEQDSSVAGAVFYVMEHVEGFNPGEEVPAAYVDDPTLRHEAALSVARVLAALGRVDAAHPALQPLRRSGSFLERQISRWGEVAVGYSTQPGYETGSLGDVRGVAAWLEERRPSESAAGVVHGDYHLNNVLLDSTRPAVAAVVDWEMATVGDPHLDLGWLLVTWPGPPIPDITGTALAKAGTLPTRVQLLDAYAGAGGDVPADLDWYTALAAFKLGILLEGTWVRTLAGLAPRETGERLHAAAGDLLALAQRVADGTWSATD